MRARSHSTIPVSVRDIEADSSLYGYTPPKWICVLFVVFFAITTRMTSPLPSLPRSCLHNRANAVLHMAQAIHSHLWWLLLTPVLAGITELIGWSGRLWSSVEGPRWLNPFLVQCVLYSCRRRGIYTHALNGQDHRHYHRADVPHRRLRHIRPNHPASGTPVQPSQPGVV